MCGAVSVGITVDWVELIFIGTFGMGFQGEVSLYKEERVRQINRVVISTRESIRP